MLLLTGFLIVMKIALVFLGCLFMIFGWAVVCLPFGSGTDRTTWWTAIIILLTWLLFVSWIAGYSHTHPYWDPMIWATR